MTDRRCPDRIEAIDVRMRAVEARHDRCAPADAFLVARLDGRGFHRLTQDMNFEKPFDETFRDAMIGAAQHLMSSGFQIGYVYAQSDEISLLFDAADATFTHKHRKLLSVLAGEASAALSLEFGRTASMDCRLLELDGAEAVADYFAWRQSDAERNCSLGHAYWALRRSGYSGRSAHRVLKGLDRIERARLLNELALVDYESLPTWQRHGFGLYHERFEKVGVNPLTGEKIPAVRRRIKVDLELPRGEAYRAFVAARLADGAHGVS